MTELSFMNDNHPTGYRITNRRRFRAAASAGKTPLHDETDEMTAARMTAEIICDYTGENAETLLNVSEDSFETEKFWDENGFEPPENVKMLIEILHRIHANS